MSSVENILMQLGLMPTTLDSAQLARLAPDIRQASLFSATVDNVKTLQSIREAAAGVLSGKALNIDARDVISAALDYYQAPEGKEGTMQDLKSVARQNLIIDQNVSRIRNLAWRESLLASPELKAWQLTRVGQRHQPRDWDTRWREAYAQLDPDERRAVDPQAKRALVQSRIWALLSRFDQPYPPFDYGSGMGVIPVSADGLQDPGSTPADASLNAGAKVSGKMDNDLKTWISDNLEVEVEFD